MAPESPWTVYTEWPKLDLAKRRLTSLALAWTVPHSPWAVEQFADLLDADGSYLGVLSYTRSRVLHYRIEVAQFGIAEGDSLIVTVRYQADTGSLVAIPRFMQEEAWLLDCLMAVEVEPLVRCHATFEYRGSPDLQTAIPLPFPPADSDRFSPFDEIRGVRGVKFEYDSDRLTEYSFTLDRLPSEDIALSLDFSMEPGSVEQMPEVALKNTAFYANRIVFKKRK